MTRVSVIVQPSVEYDKRIIAIFSVTPINPHPLLGGLVTPDSVFVNDTVMVDVLGGTSGLNSEDFGG